MSASRRRLSILTLLASVGAGALAAAVFSMSAAACVDGQTPDCSDAAAGCGYDTDGAVFSEAGSDAEAGTDTGLTDAPVDTGADAAKDG